MSYQVIARKYRPQRFADVVGQEHVTQTLANAIAQKRIAEASDLKVRWDRSDRAQAWQEAMKDLLQRLEE